MPTYQFVCSNPDCGEESDWFGSYESRPQQIPCPNCQSPASYSIGAPMVLQASYPDGMRKKSDPVWQKAKEISKLKVQRARAFKKEEKERISAEIDKVTGKKRPKKKRIIDTIKL